MARKNEFVEHVVETMRAFGAVEAKAMFGGWGLYHRGAFFALVAYDTLYLKVDPDNRARFEAEGLEPFVFEAKDGKKTAMSYRQAPDEALENPEVMAEWARLGYGAAVRAAAAKARGPKPGLAEKPKAAGAKAPKVAPKGKAKAKPKAKATPGTKARRGTKAAP